MDMCKPSQESAISSHCGDEFDTVNVHFDKIWIYARLGAETVNWHTFNLTPRAGKDPECLHWITAREIFPVLVQVA